MNTESQFFTCSTFYYLFSLSHRAIKQEDVPEVKKIKTDPELDAVEQQMREQNKIIYKYRDLLRDNLTKNQMIELLTYNDQEVPAGEDRVRILLFKSLLLLNYFFYRFLIDYQIL